MEAPQPLTPELNQPQSSVILSRIKAQQNLPLAIIAGLVAALVGALIWAVVTVTTEFQIGFMAVGVGFAVGYAVRLGKGIDKIFGYLGAGLALLGCLLGNFFALVGFASKQGNHGIFETLSLIDFSKVPEIMVSAGSAMDLLFYGIAVYEGYRFSFRRFTPEDIRALQAA